MDISWPSELLQRLRRYPRRTVAAILCFLVVWVLGNYLASYIQENGRRAASRANLNEVGAATVEPIPLVQSVSTVQPEEAQIQPTLIIDSVVRGASSNHNDEFEFHVNLESLGGVDISNVRVGYRTIKYRSLELQPAHNLKNYLPRNGGKLHVPGASGPIGLFETRILHAVFVYSVGDGESVRDFSRQCRFVLPRGDIPPGSAFEPQSTVTSMGDTMGSAFNEEFLSAFGGPVATVAFEIDEKNPDGSPNYITISSRQRTFMYNPLLRRAWFQTTMADGGQRAATGAFATKDHHHFLLSWNEIDACALYIDGKLAESHVSEGPQSDAPP